ncbi:hypothetical protein FACS1894199_09490 [Bacteroidia bacterium]|nr:hypothetical protein FACS1894199_09490 [Bacteroidia bacterium]
MKNTFAALIFILLLVLSFHVEAQTVQKLTTAGFKEKIWNYDALNEWKFAGTKPVIIDLYADWCGPCRMLTPILEEIQKDLGEKIQIYKVDTEKERDIASLFRVTSIPLMVFIPTNKQPFLVNGLRSKEELIKIIRENLEIK